MRSSQASPAEQAPPVGAPAPAVPVGARLGTTTILFDAPRTAQDLAALLKRRELLSSQLQNLTERRETVVREVRRNPAGVARQGVEARIEALDARIAQLERDLETNSRLIANAPLSLGAQAMTRDDGSLGWDGLSAKQITAITIVGTATVGAPLAILLGQTLLRRFGTPRLAPPVSDSAARLERMEQAIEAMAVEIERIGEGQRFVTQLMAPRASPVGASPVGESSTSMLRASAAGAPADAPAGDH